MRAVQTGARGIYPGNDVTEASFVAPNAHFPAAVHTLYTASLIPRPYTSASSGLSAPEPLPPPPDADGERMQPPGAISQRQPAAHLRLSTSSETHARRQALCLFGRGGCTRLPISLPFVPWFLRSVFAFSSFSFSFALVSFF